VFNWLVGLKQQASDKTNYVIIITPPAVLGDMVHSSGPSGERYNVSDLKRMGESR
jgi:hypothetical protein